MRLYMRQWQACLSIDRTCTDSDQDPATTRAHCRVNATSLPRARSKHFALPLTVPTTAPACGLQQAYCCIGSSCYRHYISCCCFW
jgi:hypothetical protein